VAAEDGNRGLKQVGRSLLILPKTSTYRVSPVDLMGAVLEIAEKVACNGKYRNQ
jgi:hypothetical protein